MILVIVMVLLAAVALSFVRIGLKKVQWSSLLSKTKACDRRIFSLINSNRGIALYPNPVAVLGCSVTNFK